MRRKFFEAKEEAPALSGWLLHQIAELYRIEAKLRDESAALKPSRNSQFVRKRPLAFFRPLTRRQWIRPVVLSGGGGISAQRVLLWNGKRGMEDGQWGMVALIFVFFVTFLSSILDGIPY